MRGLLAILSVALLFSCGSAKHAYVSEENVKSSKVSASTVMESIETGLKSILESGMEESVTVETTIYDTSRYDSVSGVSPVLSTTKTTKSKKKDSKKTSETTKSANVSAASDETANTVVSTEKHGDKSVAETKQPLYISSILFGLAFVILVCILAYWVFTKYRAKSSK